MSLVCNCIGAIPKRMPQYQSSGKKTIAKKCRNEKERIDFIIDLSNTLQVIIVAREAVSIT